MAQPDRKRRREPTSGSQPPQQPRGKGSALSATSLDAQPASLFRSRGSLLADLRAARREASLAHRRTNQRVSTPAAFARRNVLSPWFWACDTEAVVGDVVAHAIRLSRRHRDALLAAPDRLNAPRATASAPLVDDITAGDPHDAPPLPPARVAYDRLVLPGAVNGITEIIGNTPLLRFPTLSQILRAHVCAKVEFVNPAGSTKDRIARAIIERAERDRLLTPGSTIFEGTVGSTGIALATVARAKGYKCHIVMPDDQSEEKYRVLEALGATVEKVRPCSIVDENHFVNVARRRAQELNDVADRELNNLHNEAFSNITSLPDSVTVPRGFFVDQFETFTNFETHYNSTALEILHQTGGNIDALVLGAGTGGTLAGITARVKRHISWAISVLADPAGSGLYNKIKHGVMYSPFEKEGSRRRHQVDSIVEGIGMNRMTKNLEMIVKAVDDCVVVEDVQAHEMGEFVLNNDGVWVGSSSCVNIAAACTVAQRLVRERQDIRTKVVAGLFSCHVPQFGTAINVPGSIWNRLAVWLGLTHEATNYDFQAFAVGDGRNALQQNGIGSTDNRSRFAPVVDILKSGIKATFRSVLFASYSLYRLFNNKIRIGLRHVWCRLLINCGFVNYISRSLIHRGALVLSEDWGRPISIINNGGRYFVRHDAYRRHWRSTSATSSVSSMRKGSHDGTSLTTTGSGPVNSTLRLINDKSRVVSGNKSNNAANTSSQLKMENKAYSEEDDDMEVVNAPEAGSTSMSDDIATDSHAMLEGDHTGIRGIGDGMDYYMRVDERGLDSTVDDPTNRGSVEDDMEELMNLDEEDESEWPVVVTVLNDHGSRHMTKFWSPDYKKHMRKF